MIANWIFRVAMVSRATQAAYSVALYPVLWESLCRALEQSQTSLQNRVDRRWFRTTPW